MKRKRQTDVFDLLPFELHRILADLLFDPLRPDSFLSYSATCHSIRRIASSKADPAFLGLRSAQIVAKEARELVEVGRSGNGIRNNDDETRPTFLNFDACRLTERRFETLRYMAEHGSLNRLSTLIVLAPGLEGDASIPWEQLFPHLPTLRTLALEWCAPFDLRAALSSLSRLKDGKWTSSIIDLSFWKNAWINDSIVLDAIKEGRLPSLDHYRNDRNDSIRGLTSWTRRNGCIRGDDVYEGI